MSQSPGYDHHQMIRRCSPHRRDRSFGTSYIVVDETALYVRDRERIIYRLVFSFMSLAASVDTGGSVCFR